MTMLLWLTLHTAFSHIEEVSVYNEASLRMYCKSSSSDYNWLCNETTGYQGDLFSILKNYKSMNTGFLPTPPVSPGGCSMNWDILGMRGGEGGEGEVLI